MDFLGSIEISDECCNQDPCIKLGGCCCNAKKSKKNKCCSKKPKKTKKENSGLDIEDFIPPNNTFENSKKNKQEVILNKKMQINEDASVCENIPGTGTIFVKTFGCSHNISDSEFMMGQLSDFGYNISDSIDTADLVVINSCTVKNPSQDAFINLVLNAKRQGKKVVVAGCVPQGDKKIKELEELSVVGVSNIDRVVEVVNETFKGNIIKLDKKKELPTLDLPKIRKNRLIEIVPINSGCLGACTYCKTVQARGKLGSYQESAILQRISQSCKEGVSEIWITSEDTGAYGRDIGTNIAVLLKTIVQNLPKNVMLRVGMTNPPYILAHLESIAKILNHPQVYAFMHIPVQSGSNKVLDDMNREYTVQEFEQCCEKLLELVPDISIATDIICGFPGETDEQFEETLKLIEKYKFPVINISQFYPRPGTPAFKMKRVNTKDVKARSRKITQVFESYKCYENLLNTEQIVNITDVEEKKNLEKMMVGHTKGYVKTLLKYDEECLGKSVKVKVNKTLKWHIEGVIIERNPKFETPPNYFKDYNEKGVTKREEKFNKLIQDRLNRSNKISDIYTKYDLNKNETIVEETSPFQKYKILNFLTIFGILMILAGILLPLIKKY